MIAQLNRHEKALESGTGGSGDGEVDAGLRGIYATLKEGLTPVGQELRTFQLPRQYQTWNSPLEEPTNY